MLTITYDYIFPDSNKVCFDLNIDNNTLVLSKLSDCSPPAWTYLNFNKCKNCTLVDDEYPNCPVAVNLASIVSKFTDKQSYDDVTVEIKTPERVISSNTTMQRAVSSLLGLVMATSSCPHTKFLRPMARFHLPLASDEETIVRACSFFLLSEYFQTGTAVSVDMKMDKLKESYRQLQIVNNALAERLRSATVKDAAVNAVILLDLFAKTLPYSIDEALSEIRYIFQN